MMLSKHAAKRAQQRGIGEGTINLILQHGVPQWRPGGATEYIIPRRKRDEIIREKKQEIHAIERATGVGVLVGNDNPEMVITEYHKR